MRRFVLLVLALSLPFASGVFAQSSAPPSPTIAISPPSGDLTASHVATVSGLPSNVAVTAVLFDPGGEQTATLLRTDASGSVKASLQPPSSSWLPGLYRWAVALGDGKCFSATFSASDGSPHVLVEPDQPSPTSALNIVGVGFPPNSSINLTLFLTGAGGQRALQPKTDDRGAFNFYLFPQQFGYPFFSAGNYKITAADGQLTTNFMVREHPVSSAVAVDDVVYPNGLAGLLFQHYPARHYIWAIYAETSGTPVGEFLVGQTDITGGLDVAFHFPADLSPGTYLLATPYDWGETTFTVDSRPTATPTFTPTPTPTPTARPTHTPRPKAVSKHKVSCKKAKSRGTLKRKLKNCVKRK